MTLTLDQMRNKVKSQPKTTNNYDSSSIFSFSKLQPGDQIKIRFVDDGEDNDFFWRPRCTRTLRFSSLLLANGNLVDNPTYVSIPAFNIKKGDANISNLPADYLYYSNDDVINLRIKPLWDGTQEGRDLYNRFGRKETKIFQGFVRAEGYETKLYRFVINKDLFNAIESFIEDDEIDVVPTDKLKGRDFILRVTEKIANINGTPKPVKDYSTSRWSSKESPLTEEETAWLAENNPFVLKDFIPSRPSSEQERVMLEMFDASYNGEPYDVLKWGKIFRPDNVFFDEQGNIKDMKNGGTMQAPATIAQPSQPVQQVVETVQATATVQEAQPAQAPQYSQDQIAQMMAMIQAQAQSAPAQQSAPTAPQLINQHTETVEGDDPSAIIASIMGKFGNQ